MNYWTKGRPSFDWLCSRTAWRSRKPAHMQAGTVERAEMADKEGTGEMGDREGSHSLSPGGSESSRGDETRRGLSGAEARQSASPRSESFRGSFAISLIHISWI